MGIKIAVESAALENNLGGDAFFFKDHVGKILLAVVDGLGHGTSAHCAAQKVIGILERCCDLPLDVLLDTIHQGLVDTVGVVAGLVLVDQERQIIIYSGVGNIVIKICGKQIKQLLLPEGILGYRVERKVCKSVPVNPGDVLVMHTDGIRETYDANLLTSCSPEKIARDLIYLHRISTDDALVLVASDLLCKEA